MVLKALEVQGFKSFPDKTKITFDKGITCVVGPNGSGKSNISDAMRWVLGETSVKQLRGGGKMEDVIFGGTQQRGAMGYAGVSLYIDNSERLFDIENDEVVISRRYYRSGESEYGINGQNVRLKDVYEMLLDTGLGKDGYSVISQGRIAEIVGAKSSERREIFEEASGIAKYRYKKNEAERRLSSTEENLVRLRDILAELEARVGPLERESEKAKKFLEYSEQHKKFEITLWVDNVNRAKEADRTLARKVEIAQSDYTGAEQDIYNTEQAGEKLFEDNRMLELDIENFNAEIRAVSDEIALLNSRIAVFESDIERNGEAVAVIDAELDALSEGGGETAVRAAEHLADIEAKKAEIIALEGRIAHNEQMLKELFGKSAESGEAKTLLQARLADISALSVECKVQFASAEAAVAGLEARAGQIKARLESSDLAAAKAQRDEAAEFLATTGEKVSSLQNIKAGLTLKLEGLQSRFEQAQAAKVAAETQREQAIQRSAILKDLERSMSGFVESVKTIMRAGEKRELRGLIGPVSTLVSVKAGYEAAIEIALGSAMQNIVVQDESAAKGAMAYLKQHAAGRATFLPLDTIKGRRFDAKLPQQAKLAIDLVEFDEKYRNIIASLLGNIMVVENINDATYAAKETAYRYRVVTVDGQVVNAGGSYTGGSLSRSAGVFSRKQEIEELAAKQAALSKTVEELSAAEQKVKAEFDRVKADFTATESELITYSGDFTRTQIEFGRIDQHYSQLAAAFELAQAEQEQLAADAKAEQQRAATAAKGAADYEEEAGKLEAELLLLADDSGFLQARQHAQDELQELKMQRFAAEKGIELANFGIEAQQLKGSEFNARIAALNENKAKLLAKNAANAEEIEKMLLEKAQLNAKIAVAEGGKAASADKRNEYDMRSSALRAQLRELGDKKEALSNEIARLSERKAVSAKEYDDTISKLWEEYEVTFSEAQAVAVPFESITELRKTVGELRNKIRALGSVNVAAIEEFKEVNERFTFLSAQVADVEKSKVELLRLISQLSGEMQLLFTESFKVINTNFGKIFAELFGGGTARLYLENDDDILESGIGIEVTPPGKIIKNLSALSGGEQALVAISIYFAILAVNPSPFCVLDEIEAALDEVNVVRFAQYLRRITHSTQFIVITHRRGTMEEADVLYGVTMQEDGVSKLLKLDIAQVDAHMVS